MTPQTFDQARQYLARVLAWPQDGDPPAFVGIHWSFVPKDHDAKRKLPWTGRAVRSVDEAIRAVQWALNNTDTRDIYVALGTQHDAIEKTNTKGFKYQVPVRGHHNVVKLKALFIDIDAKGGLHGYDTMGDVITSLGNFVAKVGLPVPSMYVASGGGLHVYWTLDRALSLPEWEPLAFALAEATKREGLKCDSGCTIDGARVLRIPNTFNRKETIPRAVRIAGAPTDFDYSVEKLAAILEPYKVAARPAGVGTALLENPELFRAMVPVKVDNDLAAGIVETSAPVAGLKSVAMECGFVREAMLTGGKDYPNPLWNLTTLIATFTAEGVIGARVMANAHPGYTEESTDELYDRKLRERVDKNLGWPSCRTISGTGSPACAACPHFAKGKSPLNFARLPTVVPATPAAPVLPPVTQAFVAANDADMPEGYKRDVNTKKVYRVVPSKVNEGQMDLIPVCDYPLYDPKLNPTTGTLHFTTATHTGDVKNVQIDTGLIGGMSMRTVFQGKDIQIMLHEYETKPLGEFIVSWVQTLRHLKEAIMISAPFGWSVNGNHVEGFVYGGVMWTPTGQRMAPAADANTALLYKPLGDLQPWIDNAKLVTSQGKPGLDAILASSFAAPLVRATGQLGLQMSIYSIGSGLGKTTAMRTACAVWGDPIRALQGVDDTQNSVLNKIGDLRSLPMFWDELKTNEDAKKFVNVTFSLTRGREKSRLNSKIQQRTLGAWATILVSASNESLLDVIASQTKMTTAGIYRLFEFDIAPSTVGRIATSDASRINAQLNDNYGQAGLVYAEFLGNNMGRVDQEVAEFMRVLDHEVDAKEGERFWTALVAVIVMGAQYANELKLTTIDIPQLKAFMIDKLNKMRTIRDEAPVDMRKTDNVSNVLAHFLNEQRGRSTLLTDHLWLKQGKPPAGAIKVIGDASRIDKLRVHIAKADKRMRVSSQALSEWLAEKDYSRHLFMQALKEQFGMTMMKGRLGSGTEFAGATQYLIEIDLAGTPAVNFIDEA